MRQPKYKMGEKVRFSVLFQNIEVGLSREIVLDGIVSGIYYDPEQGGTGVPFYRYRVLANGGKNTFVEEADILE